ncbi:unnamed protein product [Amoebophrya sp. A25]|nr:unnamed protein product [Amoebophrya sp. A25]|eukprot:GSA25T00001074001.1
MTTSGSSSAILHGSVSSDSEFVEEVLLGLAGYTGRAVVGSPDSFALHASVVVRPAERQLCNRLLRAGFLCHELEQFVTCAHLNQTQAALSIAYPNSGKNRAGPYGGSETVGGASSSSSVGLKTTSDGGVNNGPGTAGGCTTNKAAARASAASPSIGLYGFAVAETVEAYLEQCYRPLLERLENELASSTMVQVSALVQEPLVVLEVLSELVRHVETMNKAELEGKYGLRPGASLGSMLIDHVANLVETTRDAARPVLGLCLTKLTEVFVRQLSAWCVHGTLWDPFREFLVHYREPGYQQETAAQRASSSESPTRQVAFSISEWLADLDDVEELSPSYVRFLWTRQYDVDPAFVPQLFVPPEESAKFADKVLFLGKAVRALLLSRAGLTEAEAHSCLQRLEQLMLALRARFPPLTSNLDDDERNSFDIKDYRRIRLRKAQMPNSVHVDDYHAEVGTTTDVGEEDEDSSVSTVSEEDLAEDAAGGGPGKKKRDVARQGTRLSSATVATTRRRRKYKPSQKNTISSARTSSHHAQWKARQKNELSGSSKSFVGIQNDTSSHIPPATWVMEAALSGIRDVVGRKLRQLVVTRGDLIHHLRDMKGFFGCSYGPFFQTFLDQAHELFLNPPTLFAETELAHGAWAAAGHTEGGFEDATYYDNVDLLRKKEKRFSASMAEERNSAKQLKTSTTSTKRREQQIRTRELQSRYDTRHADSLEDLDCIQRPLEDVASRHRRYQVRLLNSRGFNFQDFIECGQLIECSGGARASANGNLELTPAQPVGSTSLNNYNHGSLAGAGKTRQGLSSFDDPAFSLSPMVWVASKHIIAEPFRSSFSFRLKPSQTRRYSDEPELDTGARFALLWQNAADPSEVVKDSRRRQLVAQELMSAFSSPGAMTDDNATGGRGCAPGQYQKSDHGPGAETSSRSLEERLLENTLGLEIVVLGDQLAARVAIKRKTNHEVFCEGVTTIGDSSSEGAHLVRSPSHDSSSTDERFFTIDVSYDRNRFAVRLDDRCLVCEARDVDLYSVLGADPLGCGYVGLLSLPWEVGTSRAKLGNKQNDTQTTHRRSVREDPGSHVEQYGDDDEIGVSLASVLVRQWKHSVVQHGAEEELMIDPWHRDLNISFDIPWPLSLIVSYENLQSYNRLFRLLFAYKRALYGLSRIWLVRRQPYRPSNPETRLHFQHQFQSGLFRHRLYFFVTQILQYLQQDVIESAFCGLEKEVSRVASLSTSSLSSKKGGDHGAGGSQEDEHVDYSDHEALYEEDHISKRSSYELADFEALALGHQHFLTHVIGDCFLLEPKILRCLLAIVSISNRFVRIGNVAASAATSSSSTGARSVGSIAQQQPGGVSGAGTAPSQTASSTQYLQMEARLEAKLRQEFQQVTIELFQLLARLQSSSAKLQSLLLRLNYNQEPGEVDC